MKRYLIFATCALLLAAACKKFDFDYSSNGEALNSFQLTAPADNSAIVLNSATPNDSIVISWTPSKPGVGAPVIYTWIAALSSGSLDQPAISIPSNNSGKATSLTLTQKALDDALKAKSIADGARADLIWSVQADNGSTKLRSNQVFHLSVTRFTDGVSPFVIYGPASSTANMEINPTSTTDTISFLWQKAAPSNPAHPVSYQLYFTGDSLTFSQPLFSVTSGNNGTDTTLKLTWKQISDSLNAKGLTDLSKVAKMKWNVKATSGNFSLWSKYENKLYILRKVSFYIVGSFTGNWSMSQAMQMVVDKKPDRYSKVFYTYLLLSAGDQFKFVKTKGDWGTAYGQTGGSGGSYTTGFNQGSNFQIPSAGIYRLTIDVGNNMAYIQQKQVGVVGSMQGWNPGSPIYGGYISANRFLIITPSTGSDGFKLHDGPVWDNSTPDKARWWGIGSGPGILDLDGSGANLTATSTPRTRVIWDGTDPQQVKYIMNPGNEMRVVGDGLLGVNAWDPSTSPVMNYMGNGKWQLTANLIGGKQFKFVAGNAWGAFEYQDAGGGRVRYDGSGNFQCPAISGSYTITLDEYNSTYTIN